MSAPTGAGGLVSPIGDEDFRTRLRRRAMCQAAGRTPDIESKAGEALMELTRQKVAEAMESGIAPVGDESAPVVDDLVQRFAEVFACTPGTEFRDWMARQFEEAHDPGADQYWRLVRIVNGWQVVSNLIPVHPWLIQALRSDRAA
ncbi:hypothetical protein OG521_01390 [Streptomyces sp. NBC_01463]